MNELEFKTLMHCGVYVDTNLLSKGIYVSDKPAIYSKDETIESLIKRAEQMQDAMGKHHIPESYFNNLKKCTLVPIIIKIK